MQLVLINIFIILLYIEMTIICRNLNSNDFYKGYLDLLEQLTDVCKNEITYKCFESFVETLFLNHHIIILEDTNTNKIIGTGTILIEQKIIHNMGKIGHIEDIVVDSNYRKKGLGQQIINKLKNIGKDNNCYKIVLSSTDIGMGLYKSCGFIEKEKSMMFYYPR